jgi:hypothetical protein
MAPPETAQKIMDKSQDPEAAETAQITDSPAVDPSTACSVCGGCTMLPGREEDDDVMNTPCWKCNEHAADGGLSSTDLLAVARVIPHPWKKGQTRNVYEFPVTRKITIEADTDYPESRILAMAKRCHDKEIALDIMGGGYQMTLSSDNT